MVKIILDNATHSFLENMDLSEFAQYDCCRTVIEKLRSDSMLDAAKMKQSIAEWQNLRSLRITG